MENLNAKEKVRNELRKLVEQTKNKTNKMGVYGLSFNNPQNPKLIRFKQTVYLKLDFPVLVAIYKNSSDPSLKQAALNIENFAYLFEQVCGTNLEIKYRSDFSRKSRKKNEIHFSIPYYKFHNNAQEIAKMFAACGYKNEVKKVLIKTMFEQKGDSQELEMLFKKLWDEKKPDFQLVVDQVVKELDELVNQLDKELEKYR